MVDEDMVGIARDDCPDCHGTGEVLTAWARGTTCEDECPRCLRAALDETRAELREVAKALEHARAVACKLADDVEAERHERGGKWMADDFIVDAARDPWERDFYCSDGGPTRDEYWTIRSNDGLAWYEAGEIEE